MVEPGVAHGHACLLYRTRAEHARAVGEFVAEGLARGERCLYVVHHHQPGEVVRLLRAEGIDVDRAIERGALLVRGQRETYLRGSRFDARRMLDYLAAEARDARWAGFKGLRATGEMTWASGPEPGREALLLYEELLNDFTEAHGIHGLCQYNVDRFEPELVEGVARVHPRVVSAPSVGAG